MEEKLDRTDGGRSLDEILASVEQDESLQGARSTGTTEGTASPPDGESGALLGSLLSNPMLLSKLPALMQAFRTLSEPLPHDTPSAPQSPEALLCALRPYLGQRRRQAIDTMIRVSKLSATLRSLR